MQTAVKVECQFCHTQLAQELAWESAVRPGRWWCDDEVGCNRRWMEWAKNMLDVAQ